jgi:hypothetical protein
MTLAEVSKIASEAGFAPCNNGVWFRRDRPGYSIVAVDSNGDGKVAGRPFFTEPVPSFIDSLTVFLERLRAVFP